MVEKCEKCGNIIAEEQKTEKININKFIDYPQNIDEKDDVGGMGNFVTSLFNEVINENAEKGLIISVCGDWGSGKTSIKNTLLSRIDKHNSELHKDDMLNVLIFDPWQVPPSDDITKYFLSELSNSIPGSQGLKMLRYLNVKIEKDSLDLIIRILILLFGASFFTSIASAFHNVNKLILFLWLSAIILVIVFLPKLLGALLENKFSSINIARKEIEEKLENKKLLVVIDDIDRLPTDEIPRIIRLIKSVCNFHNIIYLVFWQRSVIEAALSIRNMANPNDETVKGAEYLKKIVQIEMEVPKISRKKLVEMLSKSISEIFNYFNLPKGISLDCVRIERFIKMGLKNNLSGIRDIKRFIASFIISFPRILDEGNPIIDVTDFILLELVKVFDNPFYHLIHANKDILISNEEIIVANIEKFFEPSNRLRKAFFYAFSEVSPRYSSSSRMLLKKGFFSDDGFDTYFVCAKEASVQSAQK